jgi:hypothetical protein
LLEGLFPGKVTEHDPFTSVAGGLAIADYHGYRWERNRFPVCGEEGSIASSDFSSYLAPCAAPQDSNPLLGTWKLKAYALACTRISPNG